MYIIEVVSIDEYITTLIRAVHTQEVRCRMDPQMMLKVKSACRVKIVQQL